VVGNAGRRTFYDAVKRQVEGREQAGVANGFLNRIDDVPGDPA
jgi:hypothetical protein